MWRAQVLTKIDDAHLMVTIPALYRGDPIGPVQTAVAAEPGERVVVADLAPTSRANDWWVVGYESQIGRWGAAYLHTHPIGQVDGLVDALAGKADDTDLAAYATTTALTDGLATKVNTSTYTSGMSTKADLPGDWSTIGSSYWTTDTVDSRPLSIRSTPFGTQISGRVRLTADLTLDLAVATLPTAHRPFFPIIINVPAMGPGTAYAAIKCQFELHASGTITAREAVTSGTRMSFNETLFY